MLHPPPPPLCQSSNYSHRGEIGIYVWLTTVESSNEQDLTANHMAKRGAQLDVCTDTHLILLCYCCVLWLDMRFAVTLNFTKFIVYIGYQINH